MVKRIKSLVQNLCNNSNYLIANKHVLQKFFLVFKDMSLCVLSLFMSPYMNEYLSEDRRKKAKICWTTIYLYIIVFNYTAVVGIYTVTCLSARNLDNFVFEDKLTACCENQLYFGLCPSSWIKYKI